MLKKLYATGQEILDGDLCFPVRKHNFARLMYITMVKGDVLIKFLYTSKPTLLDEEDFDMLGHGQAVKHENLVLYMRKKQWQLLLTKIWDKYKNEPFDMDYEIPQKAIDVWTKNNTDEK